MVKKQKNKESCWKSTSKSKETKKVQHIGGWWCKDNWRRPRSMSRKMLDSVQDRGWQLESAKMKHNINRGYKQPKWYQYITKYRYRLGRNPDSEIKIIIKYINKSKYQCLKNTQINQNINL